MTPVRTQVPSRRRARLKPPWRKLLLTVHVLASVGLLGVDTAILALVTSGWLGADPVTTYPAADLVGGRLILPLALIALITGVVLGKLTPWGVLRHWWVLIKLLLTAAGTVLAIVVLLPNLRSAAVAALAGDGVADPGGLVQSSVGAWTMLVIATVLSYYKPLGRVRGRTAGARPIPRSR